MHRRDASAGNAYTGNAPSDRYHRSRGSTARRQIRRAAMTASTIALGLSGVGCVTVVSAPAARAPVGLPTPGLASSAAAVFAGPEVDAAVEGVELAAAPEFARNDRHVNLRSNEPYTALDAWPQPGIPDISRARVTTFTRGNRAFILFQEERTRRPGTGRGY